jgi:hypothetical protein
MFFSKNAQAAKTDIEKIEKEKRDTQRELDKQELMKKAIRIILTVRDDGASAQKIEMAWVGDTSDGKFQASNMGWFT